MLKGTFVRAQRLTQTQILTVEFVISTTHYLRLSLSMIESITLLNNYYDFNRIYQIELFFISIVALILNLHLR